MAGSGATVTGSGSPSNPYVVQMDTTAAGTGGSGGSGRYVGEVMVFAGAVPPAGWFYCHGAAVSRTVYADLFAVIGVSFGAGDGSTTFNLPNTDNRFVVGEGAGRARGYTGGSETKTLTAAQVPAHTHATDESGTHRHDLDLATSTGTNGANVPTASATFDRVSNAAVGADGSHTHNVLANTGGGQAFDIMPPMVAFPYCIKY